MTLIFHPLFHKHLTDPFPNKISCNSILEQQKGLTVIISLIDLKPQQLPIPSRRFILTQFNQPNKLPTQSDSLQIQQQQVYSNLQLMLWVSEPIQMENYQWLPQSNSFNSNKRRLEKEKMYVRYVYLPPLSEYVKHYGQKIKQLSQTTRNHSSPLISLGQNCIIGNKNSQLSHQTQLVIEQRHQVMYCLARQLSSAVVFEFGSKYIRFDHHSFQDYKNITFNKFNSQNYINTNQISQKLTSENQEIPHYVVIKSSSYSSETDFQVYKVKLSNNQNSSSSHPSSSRSNTSSLNISMQIESKSVMPIKKIHNCQTNDLSNRQLASITDKFLKLSEIQLNKGSKGKSSEQNDKNNGIKHLEMQTICTQNSMLIENQIEVENEGEQNNLTSQRQEDSVEQNEQSQEHLIDRQQVKWMKPFHYSLFVRILSYYCGPHEYWIRERSAKKMSNRRDKSLTKENVDKALFYYRNSFEMMGIFKILSNQDKQSMEEEVLRQILTKVMFISNNHSEQVDSQCQNRIVGQVITFELIEEIQNFMVKHLRDKFQIEQVERKNLASSKDSTKQSELTKLITNTNSQEISQVQTDFIQQLHFNLTAFIQTHLIDLMKNQYLNLIQQQYPSHHQIKHQTNDLKTTLNQIPKTTIPILEVQIPIELRKDLSQKLYSTLSQKLSSYQVEFPQQLPLIFSYPLEVQYLKTTISNKDSHIHKLNQEIGILEFQLQEKQSVIEQQQSQIQKYKLDQIFYQQVLKELNQVQSQLNHQTQLKQKLTIDLQCTQILNIQAKQTIQTQQLMESRLLQQKKNFLEAISHLSKQNQHYISLSQQLQSTIDSLNKKIDHYQLIDLQINSLNLENLQLKLSNQSIKTWKSSIQQSHQDLIRKQVHKFNHVLKINYQKFIQIKKQSQQMKNHINNLTTQLQTQTKNCLLLQDQINYLKSRYFRSNHLSIDYSEQKTQQPFNNIQILSSAGFN